MIPLNAQSVRTELKGQQVASGGVQHSIPAAGNAQPVIPEVVVTSKNSFDVLGHIPTDLSYVATSQDLGESNVATHKYT